MRFTKLRGQHILADAEFAERIVAAAELKPDTVVLEVGPGLGVLTGLILAKTKNYFGIELDPRFAAVLREKFSAASVIEADILKTDLRGLVGPKPYVLVSNLPYNITSAFLKKIMSEENPPARIVIMIQKEVALRVANAASDPSVLGLMSNLYAKAEHLFNVPAGAFSPPPKVESAVIRLTPYSEKEFYGKWGFGRARAEEFIGFVSKFFLNPRKKMANALGRARAEEVRAALVKAGESPDARPADLRLPKWAELWKLLV